MKYYLDSDTANFPWWGGAWDNFQDLKKHQNAWDCVENYLNEISADGSMSETDVYDIMWFELEDWLIENKDWLFENNFKDTDGTWLD